MPHLLDSASLVTATWPLTLTWICLQWDVCSSIHTRGEERKRERGGERERGQREGIQDYRFFHSFIQINWGSCMYIYFTKKLHLHVWWFLGLYSSLAVPLSSTTIWTSFSVQFSYLMNVFNEITVSTCCIHVHACTHVVHVCVEVRLDGGLSL